MKFAKNCVFLVDSAIEISIALGKFLEIPPRGLRPLGGISKKFPRARKISGRIPSKTAISPPNLTHFDGLDGLFLEILGLKKVVFWIL